MKESRKWKLGKEEGKKSGKKWGNGGRKIGLLVRNIWEKKGRREERNDRRGMLRE